MATASIPVPLLTAEEYADLAPEGRTELVRGEIVQVSPSFRKQGKIASRIHLQLGPFVEAHGLGETYIADAGFIISRNPDSVRAPDVAFVVQSRLPPGELPDGFFPGTPDLAVEVVSPSDRWYEVEEKVLEYLAAGTTEVWVVDPRHQRIEVCTGPRLEKRVLHVQDTLTTPLLPGFSLPLDRLFG